ncbi:MAG: hypothetical protein QMD32_06240 [Smithellaceae bacterium]|nr:hypothetical protein [Smithellaceae bacterium]
MREPGFDGFTPPHFEESPKVCLAMGNLFDCRGTQPFHEFHLA